MTLSPISPGDGLWPAFEAALRSAGLVTEDLGHGGGRYFALDDGVGFGGFERLGGSTLVRSIVVAPHRRGQGLGSALLQALIERARCEGAGALWLLTTDAAPFFARQGFSAVARSAAPPEIAATAQFVSLCSASAELMCRKPA